MDKTSVSREKKRARFTERPRSRIPRVGVLIVAVVLVVGVGAVLSWARRPNDAGASGGSAATLGHAPYPQVTGEKGVVRIPLATFQDGEARYYTYMHGDRPIEFFALRSSDGVVRAAYNACDVCFAARKGYRQDGDDMVCNNCGQRFASRLINEQRGDCNPSPLDRTVEGDALLIQAEDIVAGADLF